ncbi:MAG: HAMP domain-containing protein [Proteobacteria bacterium]|nr:HAMP domain-containing protein [Pseudomonadota bacterium]
MFCGLLAVQAVGLWLMLEERSKLGERLVGEYVAQRIASIISILDVTLPADRPQLVRALSGRLTRYSLDEPWQAAGADESDEGKAFLARMGRELDRPRPMQVLSIGPVDQLPSDGASREEMSPDRAERALARASRGPYLVVVAQARLADYSVLTIRRALPPPAVNWPLRTLILLTLLGLFVALLAGWALRRVTRPLASLADAASGLARDLNRPALPETGPQEVARVARAFNAMQRDLQRVIEARSQALAGVSHDLRLPLTRLRLRLEKLPEGDLRAKIEDDLAEMDALIGSTLEFLRAGSDSEKPARLNLNALIEAIVEDLEPLGARITVRGTAPAPVFAQPQAIRRCLTNLLENARRYGGPDIDLEVAEKAGRLVIRVEDRGPGIPAADFDRVFEPYVRLEASRARHTGGTGLGLAIARAVARANGGDIHLEARAGGGLSAVLVLPLPRPGEDRPAGDPPANVLVPVHKLP